MKKISNLTKKVLIKPVVIVAPFLLASMSSFAEGDITANGPLSTSEIVASGVPAIEAALANNTSGKNEILEIFMNQGLPGLSSQKSQTENELISNLERLRDYARNLSQTNTLEAQIASGAIGNYLQGGETISTVYHEQLIDWQLWLQQFWLGLNGGEMPAPFAPEKFARLAAHELIATAYVSAASTRRQDIQDLFATGVLTIPIFRAEYREALELAIQVEQIIESRFQQAFGAIYPVPVLLAPQLKESYSANRRTLTIESEGASLRVYDYSGQGRPIVLLHGGPGSAHYLHWLAEFLQSHNRRVITFDQRGSGNSTNPSGDYSVSAYVTDFIKVLEYSGVQSADVFGHSWGGLYAQLVTQQHPDIINSLYISNSTVLDAYANPSANAERVMTDIAKLGVLDAKRYLTYAIGFQVNARAQLALPMEQQNWQKANYFFQWYNSPSAKVFVQQHALFPQSTPKDRAGISGEAYLKTTMEVGKLAASSENNLAGFADEVLDKKITVFYGENGDIIGQDFNKLLKMIPEEKGRVKHIIADGVGHTPWLEKASIFETSLIEHFDLE